MPKIKIDDLLGVKYTHNGRSLKNGFDCYGLAIEVSKRYGHQLPDEDYFKSSTRNFGKCRDIGIKQVSVKKVEEPQKEGDIILFKSSSVLNHIGIYIGNSSYIHCDKHGVHICKLGNRDIGVVYTWL